ncbi:FAD-dependent oxidoreductase [Undibacterium terreum]|uniref:Pyridine nucleotide-disulfide oxidoreductase n=1 Tax=Undibacterium terreum TaxID=1224302 RepID=A0A916ULJ2_9BURK|nr:FAD-dependent oxidoreductase [Undibacterium terreum]GGC76884.1 pyridine nucleotide-disulfide oxidoreductase [Undibacterium terreum]
MTPIIIIGTGLAGYTVAREFRKLDKIHPLLIITADDGGFYSKPMLSNAFAQNKQAAQLVTQSVEKMAEQTGATILTKTTVNTIDTAAKTVSTSAGNFSYEKLVIATGAKPIRLNLEGDAAGKVLSVNDIADYAVFREQIAMLPHPARVTILGAGLIGCEFADDLAGAGHEVSLVDPNPMPLAALAPAALSLGLHTALTERNIKLKLGTTAASVDANGAGLTVTLANGDSFATDVVLSAVGLRPDLRVAQAAQLVTDRGILIDTTGKTSAADVYALGDCAQYTFAEDGSSRILPYIAPLMSAARAIAKTLNGQPTEIDLKPSPVIVKTPSYPLALVSPAPHHAPAGRWEVEQRGASTIARFYTAEDVISGFAVAPQDAGLRQSLLAELAEKG